MFKMINAGHGNMMAVDKVVAIISPNSAPAKRLKDQARDEGRLVDITQGRRTRSFIITVGNQVFLSAVQVDTLATRFQQEADRATDSFEVIRAEEPVSGGAGSQPLMTEMKSGL